MWWNGRTTALYQCQRQFTAQHQVRLEEYGRYDVLFQQFVGIQTRLRDALLVGGTPQFHRYEQVFQFSPGASVLPPAASGCFVCPVSEAGLYALPQIGWEGILTGEVNLHHVHGSMTL